jgi:hypothetical protein
MDSLAFSPNPELLESQLGLRKSKMAKYIVLKYLFEDSEWLNLSGWSLAVDLVENSYSWESYGPYRPDRERKLHKKLSYCVALTHLVQIVGPEELPTVELRERLLKGFLLERIDKSELGRDYKGMHKSYKLALDHFTIRKVGGKRYRKPRRKRSSEDSHGIPRNRVWRPGIVQISLPELQHNRASTSYLVSRWRPYLPWYLTRPARE